MIMKTYHGIQPIGYLGEWANLVGNVDRKFYQIEKKLQELLFGVLPVSPSINIDYFLSSLDEISFLNLLLT